MKMDLKTRQRDHGSIGVAKQREERKWLGHNARDACRLSIKVILKGIKPPVWRRI
jgi:hypothetical protein